MCAQAQPDPRGSPRGARWQVHFTSTGASWNNLVQHYFGLVTDKQIS